MSTATLTEHLTAAPAHVFVYGTLLKGEHNHRLWEEDVVQVRKAAARGFALHYVRWGGYPVMVPDPTGVVYGEVQTVLRGTNLTAVNRMEVGAGYTVEQIRVQVQGEPRPCTVLAYVYRERAVGSLIPSGSWRHR